MGLPSTRTSTMGLPSTRISSHGSASYHDSQQWDCLPPGFPAMGLPYVGILAMGEPHALIPSQRF